MKKSAKTYYINSLWWKSETSHKIPDKCVIRPHKKTKLFLVPSLLTFGCRITFFFFFFFFYKNADNALEIELKRSKIEMPLSFLKDFYTWNMFRHVFVQM